MILKTKHIVEQEHEIELPHYRTIPSKQYYYKIIDDNTCLMVCVGNSLCCGIEFSFPSQAFLHDGNFEITKEVFDEAYKNQLELLVNLKTK